MLVNKKEVKEVRVAEEEEEEEEEVEEEEEEEEEGEEEKDMRASGKEKWEKIMLGWKGTEVVVVVW